ncbi:LysR family transcriptional regulator [Sellimonas intestinalis]|uniref:LysR family transcriptional regulator n=1 Tax=Sellimonas intestinalis TaxID=1653434 RepID=UPI0015EC833C|nr:LysR family transcriptional regulator [Sellimonas intestinalis]MBA2212583.1 LysR family transcriptional regulator [Sellimonas intestinalis]
MELRVLNYFLAIAREENFTKAAHMLHVTQPTLSRQIADLEQELGVKLFVRSNHNIILTEDGMILKRRAQEILSLADKTKRDFLQKDNTLSGTISIGSGEFLSTKCLAEIIAAFKKKYPHVKYEIYSGNANNIRDYIERGFLDIGLMLEPVDIRKYNFVNMPIKEQWGVFVPSNSELSEKKSIRPEDLAGMSVITATGDFNQSLIGKWLGEYSEQVDIAATGNLLYNEAMLAEENIGYILGIKLNCTYDNLRFIPLYPALESSTVLAWKKEQIFSATTSSFINFTEQYLKSISRDKI